MNLKNTRLRTIEIYGVLATDLITAMVCYFVAHFLKFKSFSFGYMPEMYTTFLLVILMMTLLYTILINPSADFSRRGYLVEFAFVTKYTASILVVMASLLFMLKYAEDYSRLMFGYFIVLLEILTYISHIMLKKAIRNHFKDEKNQTRLVIITDSKHRENIEEKFNASLDIMRGITGYIIWDGSKDEEFGNKDTYKEKVKLMPIDEVFIYLPNAPKDELTDLISYFEMMGVTCNYGIDVSDEPGVSGVIDTLAGFTVISYSINNVDYNKRMLKRAMDIAGGVIGSILTVLLTPFIALAIVIDDPGPVFFKQKRVGRNGRLFNIYKFRSMCRDAEEKKAELEQDNEAKGLMFKMENDPRITKVGKFLRKTSLDEFPQFFNILKGDMSLVGTRPPTVDEYEQYDPHYKRRLSMKPGLTGLWQVSGRSDITDFDEVVKLDLEYIDNWSLSLDLKILLKTIGAVFTGRGSK